jgi:hypothetical protein
MESMFKQIFHVDQQTFDEILHLIEPIMMERDAKKAINSSGSQISAKTRLAVAL